jgi:hypothetical protein
MSKKVIVAQYQAEGGPEVPFMGSDGHEAGPTDAGDYVVAYCAKHRSVRYPQWSGIPWGAKLKTDGGVLLVQLDGRWQDVFKLTGVTRAEVEDYHERLYRIRKVPDTWVFNDFGHLTCYLFKDRNRNRKLDAGSGERIHGEFFHTTPDDEAATALHTPVHLEPSHGCIHLKPLDIDLMVKRGFMKKGVRVVVHEYKDTVVRLPTSGVAKPPYELHFYPGLHKVLVVSVRK